MKNLHQSLIDYNIVHLEAIAACRGISLTTTSHTEAVNQLTETLLAPAAVAIVLADLADPEKEALQSLLAHGGQIEALRFIRDNGPVRPMGPARLAREKPWQNPVNPTEGLWYRGLIFKAFQMTEQGGLEIIYIPTDLLTLLQTALDSPAAEVSPPVSTFEVVLAPEPVRVVSGKNRLRENIFGLLVYLQTTPVRLHQKTDLAAKDRATLTGCLLPPLLPPSRERLTPEAELDFWLHLAQRAGLLVISHGRLRPAPDQTRTWLQAHPAEQEQTLQNIWRTDPTWNDLWHVPGLAPQPTGWENSPLLARSRILDYLSQLAPSPENWYSLDDFVASIKQLDPDFQRPTGDYHSWYILDEQGRSLMGFENWDRVEGALIRYLVSQILLVLGVVDLGLPDETSAPTAFRITGSGAAFLAGRPASALADQKPRFLQASQNFTVLVPAQASLYDRFQLARFAELDSRHHERVSYQITQASVGRAMRNGVTADQIVAFLGRATNNRTPLKVVETLRDWGARRSTAKIERATLLHLSDEALVAELSQHPDLSPLLGKVIGPKTILLPADNVQEVRRILAELGYLENQD